MARRWIVARKITAPDRVVLLLSLIPYLAEHGETPLGELAEAFDVPPRMLRELIEFLGTAGVPGETRTYQDEDLFDIDWAALEEQDLVRLTRVVAVDDAPRFSVVERTALIAGLHALTPLLPDSEREHARSAAEKLRAANIGARSGDTAHLSVTAEPEDPRLAVVAEAIDRGLRLGFSYRDLQGTHSERRVEPLGLSQSDGGWYLRAHCLDRGAERTFIVDGMREPRVLPQAAERRPSGRRMEIGPAEVELVAGLRMRERALGRLSGFSPRVVGPSEPGWVLAEVDLAYASAAIRLVQAAPGDVVVESPNEAREAVRDWADRALARYRS
jgi:proteasome accessory factor C